MKRLSGDILSRVLFRLNELNKKTLSKEEICKLLIEDISAVENLYVDLKGADIEKTFSQDERSSLIEMSSLEKLNVLLPWCSFSETGSGNVLGSAWSERKRSVLNTFPDPLVKKLSEKVSLNGLSILEVGCFEGHHTASLAQFSNDVCGVDGRIENVIKTLVRCWLMELEQKVRVECIDIEKASISSTLAKLGRSKGFDLIYNRGVLYHLSNPVGHLVDIAQLCEKHIYLHTQIASQEQATDSVNTEVGELACFKYKEPKVAVSPFSGMTPGAVWLTKNGLLEVLNYLGFSKVTIYSEKIERNGPRIELLASR